MLVSTTFGGDVGWIEDFSLAKDRAAALKALIPGTRLLLLPRPALPQYRAVRQSEGTLRPLASAIQSDRPRLTEIQTRHALLT